MSSRIALLALVSCTLSCSLGQAFTPPEPGFERMLTQPRGDPFEESTFFDDGRIMRKPPEGTVPITRTVGQPLYTEGIAEGVYADKIPVPLTRAFLERGRDRFEVYCAACHGLAGDGVSVVASAMALRKPPSLHDDDIRKSAPGRIYRIVQRGYGLMAGYAYQLSIDDRWAVVAYVRALQRSRRVEVHTLPPAVRAELAAAIGEAGGGTP